VTTNHLFKRKKKNEKDGKKRRIVLNGGRERMELKKLKNLGWSTCTYWRSATGNALEGQ
jgi:G:T-mismatch repair DNA endonuclease (very short patch repair protein)